jgi:hypothetical protein
MSTHPLEPLTAAEVRIRCIFAERSSWFQWFDTDHQHRTQRTRQNLFSGSSWRFRSPGRAVLLDNSKNLTYVVDLDLSVKTVLSRCDAHPELSRNFPRTNRWNAKRRC